MKIADLYQSVTDAIIGELERGAAPWVQPWKGRGLLPTNAATGRRYHGINIPILWGAATAGRFSTHRWMTYKQAEALGAHVRKGGKGTHVVFAKRLSIKDAESEEEITRNLLKAYVVFNIAQIDGLPAVEEPEPVDDVAAVEHRQTFADCFIATTGADLRTGEMACFMPGLDVIELPPKHVFATPESYYATALHELGHWSGHASRLARDLTGRFGSRSYAAEELVAELTAAFLCAHLAIQGELRHAGYIQSWIELLRDDKRAIFTAASQASQAAGYLRAFSEEIEADDNFTAP